MAASESCQHYIDDLKGKLHTVEDKSTRLEIDFNRQSQDLLSLRGERDRLAFEVKALRIWISQFDSRLKASEDKSLEKR